MLRHGGSQPRKEEGALHLARRVKNAEAFLKSLTRYTPAMQGEGRSAATAWKRRGGLEFAGGSGTYAIIEA